MTGPADLGATPPAGYALAKGCSDYWIAADKETMKRGWIITPAWSPANGHTLELWTAKDDPNDSCTRLTPKDAIELAADLLGFVKDALSDGDAE